MTLYDLAKRVVFAADDLHMAPETEVKVTLLDGRIRNIKNISTDDEGRLIIKVLPKRKAIPPVDDNF